ncbi:hypothetical protein COY90_04170 [Candidatus Roizmanbacteria bacterium CG_4_10_14_0_8_um_filter_39_9]|uniref:Membrane protein 6-pyruvoyl-tetrahydropterin synthase-related domain-containing protein n=1 Tax=Candidatus Roizmanbacteria bacterium CG_4_10_14_0_8_um_filter_39_9 TaxID=1974829 RepID=A0A2M7QC21_9BACT|nr:MAG: hypothetical protein COY90_04170 [Candidatus Roizmanbacteria bacterium CG_4_10_14_0_8_um_filter_39_9]
MNDKKRSLLIFLLFLFIVFVGFSFLFIPSLKVLITPGGVLSDNVKFHYPLKYFYQQKLRMGQLPFWSSSIGGGFPLLAQSEITTFNPITVLTLAFLPLGWAINIQLIFYLTLLCCSVYFLGKVLKLSRPSSFIFSLLFSFSPVVIFNLDYSTVLQSLAYLPLSVGLAIIYFESFARKTYVLLILCLALQLLSGHFQIFFITGYIIVFIAGLNYLKNRYVRSKIFYSTILLFAIVTGITALQVLPTIEFYQNSSRSAFNSAASMAASVPFDLVLTFINPFLFGNPSTDFAWANRGPEVVNLFTSVLTLVLVPITLLLIFFKKNKFKFNKYFISFLLIAVFSLVLGFDKSSPLSFILSIPPFSFFRFNTRFWIVVVLFLSFSTSYFMEKIILLIRTKRFARYIFAFIILILLVERFILIKTVSQSISPSRYMKLQQFVRSTRNYNSVSKDAFFIQNIAKQKGPFSRKSTLLALEIVNRTMGANYNLIAETNSMSVDSGVGLSRPGILNTMVENTNFTFGMLDEGRQALSPLAVKILQYGAVDTFSTMIPLTNPSSELQLISKSKSLYLPEKYYYIYRVQNSKKRVQFYSQYKRASTLEEYKRAILDSSDNSLLVVEENLNIDHQLQKLKSDMPFKLIQMQDTSFYVDVDLSEAQVMVVADTYYPGWTASIDGKIVKIFRANLAYQGVVVPKGKHRVAFNYIPTMFYIGLAISAVTLSFLYASQFIKRDLCRFKK